MNPSLRNLCQAARRLCQPCEKEVPEEPPEQENKNGGTRTAAENSAVLFLLLYDYLAVKQQQRDLDKGINMDMQLNPEQQIQSSRPSRMTWKAGPRRP